MQGMRSQILEGRKALRCPGCGVLMLRHAVSSSNIVAVGWERDESGGSIMEVEFNGGVVYQYTDVPEWVFQGLIFSPSPGRFLRSNIIDSYSGQRIE